VQQQTLAGPQNPSRLFSQEHNNDIAHHAEASRQKEPVDWKRLAHVQLVTDHHSVCSAMMIFGDLARLKSPARRVLVFPQQWAMEKQAAKHDTIDPYMDVTRRLLRRAARRYNVELRPVAFDSSSDSSAMASLWALTDMDRVMMLQTPGLIQHAELLDTLLAYSSSTAPLALLEPGHTKHTDTWPPHHFPPYQLVINHLFTHPRLPLSPESAHSLHCFSTQPLTRLQRHPIHLVTLHHLLGSQAPRSRMGGRLRKSCLCETQR
jgi:hypothetical protein